MKREEWEAAGYAFSQDASYAAQLIDVEIGEGYEIVPVFDSNFKGEIRQYFTNGSWLNGGYSGPLSAGHCIHRRKKKPIVPDIILWDFL